MTRIVVTGLGCINALGSDVDAFWSALIAGRSGVREPEWPAADRIKMRAAARVQDHDPARHFTSSQLAFLDPFSQFALIAAREAAQDSGLNEQQRAGAGVVLGSGDAAGQSVEQAYRQLHVAGKERLHPLTVPRCMASSAVSHISIDLGIRGPVFGVTSACSSAAHAIIQAVLLLRSGVVEVALAGGSEAPFSVGLIKAWEALRVLSAGTCRPFSRQRDGLVLGEGAAMLVLETEAHARARGARIYAELAGFGMSSDAGHITDPSVDGAAAAMTAALRNASMAVSEVGYINAHGTGTQANDVTESRAIRRVFGADADCLAVSSTKAAHGHALGASGAFEAVATILALRDGCVPPTLNFTEPGEDCDLDYVPNQARTCRVKAALSNSFAFGGLNAVLALRTWD
jgi:nodulation protein E